MAGLNPAAPAAVFCSEQTAREAIELALPMIRQWLDDPHICGSGCLCIVVMDPAKRWPQATFADAVLLEHDAITRNDWDADYAAFARAKARAAWEHGCDSAAVQARRPQCLREGDSLLWGGVWLDGIVVAASGAMPWYDEAIACCVAANLRALAKMRFAEAQQAGQLFAGTKVNS